MGNVFGDSIFPIWKNLLYEMYPAPLITRYREIVLSCSKRAGKSLVMSISMLYEIYKLTCMIDPAKIVMNVGNSDIFFALLSYDEAQIISGLGKYIINGLEYSPYFQDILNGKKLARSSLDKDGMQLTDNIVIIGGSGKNTVIGRNIYAAAYDEINIPSPNISESKLVPMRMEIYRELLDRIESTLTKAPPGSGILWMASSPTDLEDVINNRIKEVDELDLRDSHTKVIDNLPRWVAREESTEKTFSFFVGSDTRDPQFLEKDYDRNLYDEGSVIEVPDVLAYRNMFKTAPITSIRDIAGRRTYSDIALFNSRDIFEKVFCKDNDIFTTDTPEINFNIDKDGNDKGGVLNLEDYLYNKNYFKNCDRKNCYRYIHLDIAGVKDRFGIASVYSDLLDFKSTDGLVTRKRMYFIDFCLGVTATPGCAIDIFKVLTFIHKIAKIDKYPIKLVTTDSYQGTLARQIISKKGVQTEYLSVEKTKEPFYNLKNIVMSESLIGYKNPLLVKELIGLKDYGNNVRGKIDKSSRNSTDDLAGALAGALWSCFKDNNFKNNEDIIDNLLNLNISNTNNLNILNTNNALNNKININKGYLTEEEVFLMNLYNSSNNFKF
jgi:hypothetical protein